MNVQAAPPTFSGNNAGRPPAGNPPVLGQQVPGMTGGLPAQGGLSVLAQPMARQLQSMGRGEDTMLVHMTPNEVNSLQGLAMASGGSLTINPHTGLPEAGWLGKLLPTILGAVGAAFGIPTWALFAGGTAVGTAATGDLGKGLMAGLGAYGGAGLANAAGLGSSLGNIGGNAASNVATNAATTGATTGAATGAVPGAATGAVPGAATGAVTGAPGLAAPPAIGAAPAGSFEAAFDTAFNAGNPSGGLAQAMTQAQTEQLLMGMPGAPVDLVPQALGGTATASTFAPTAAGLAENTAASVARPNFLTAFKNATNIPGTGNVGAIAGGLGVLSNISEAAQPNLPKYEPEDDEYKYEGPYMPVDRPVTMPTTSARERGGREHLFFENTNPIPGYTPYRPIGMAEGGAVPVQRERNFGFKSLGNDIMPAPQGMGNAPGGIKGAALAQRAAGGFPAKGRATMAPASAPAPQMAPAMQRAMPMPRRGMGERDFGFRPTSEMAVSPYANPYGGGTGAMGGAPRVPGVPAFEMTASPYSRAGGFNPMAVMYAKGGEVPMEDGAFVLDARTVSEIGNGSSNAGKEILRSIGGRAVEGPGDGVSDSIPARIGRNQPARVARDEVIVPAQAVRRIGKGSPKRGADKLYDLMKKAHKARKNAKRGQDTKLRKGLA